MLVKHYIFLTRKVTTGMFKCVAAKLLGGMRMRLEGIWKYWRDKRQNVKMINGGRLRNMTGRPGLPPGFSGPPIPTQPSNVFREKISAVPLGTLTELLKSCRFTNFKQWKEWTLVYWECMLCVFFHILNPDNPRMTAGVCDMQVSNSHYMYV